MKKVSLKQEAYDTIREKILSCEYKPNSVMTEEMICYELNMSRTPVRDAVGRLEQEQLLVIMPKKGFIVAPVSIEDLNMVYEGRFFLEPYIIRHYCAHLGEEVLQRLKTFIDAEENSIGARSLEPYDYDQVFHSTLVEQCTNRYFLQTYKNICNQNARIRVMTGKASEARLRLTVEEHRDIYNALVMDDAETAAKNMEIHLQNAKKESFRFFLNF